MSKPLPGVTHRDGAHPVKRMTHDLFAMLPNRRAVRGWRRSPANHRFSQALLPRRAAAWAVSLVTLLGASSAAGGGLYQGSKGARAAGRAGAFTARADDLTAVVANPAGLVQLGGLQLQVGNRFTYYQHEFTRADTVDPQNDGALMSFGSSSNRAPWQLLDPLVAVSYELLEGDLVVAFSAMAPAGVGHARYAQEGGQRYMMVERDALMLGYNLSAAYRFSEVLSLGATLQALVVPELRYGLVIDGNPFAEASPVRSRYDALANVRGSDLFTPQAIIGLLLHPARDWQLGLAAQVIPADLSLDANLNLQLLNPDTLGGSPDVELVRGFDNANDVGLTLPLPMWIRGGVRYAPTGAGWDLELDVSYETWSRARQFTLDSRGIVAQVDNNPVDIGTILVKKQWQDTFGVMLGGDIEVVGERLVLRAGAFAESGAAPDSYSSIDFAASAQMGGALGIGAELGDALGLATGALQANMSFTYAQYGTVGVSESEGRGYQQVPASRCVAPYTDPDTCATPGQPSPVVNAGRYGAYIHSTAVDLRYRF